MLLDWLLVPIKKRPGISGYLRPEPWQLKYLFKIGRNSWLFHIILTSLVFFSFQGKSHFFFAWIILMLVFSVIMVCISRYGSKLDMTADAGKLLKLGLAHTIVTTGIGLLWGAGAIAATRVSPEHAHFFALALGGTALGAASSQSVVMRSCLFSLWSSIPLLALAYWRPFPYAFGHYYAFMMLLFGLVLTVMAVRMHGFLMTNHSLAEKLEKKYLKLEESAKELEAARKMAVSANIAKSRLLAFASHDLRQPLHAIGLLNDNLQHEKMSAFARKTVEKIALSVISMSALFRTLLDYAALDLGKVNPQFDRHDLVELLQGVAKRNLEAGTRAQCEISVQSSPCWVETDHSLLTNIVQNLVSNAIKYAPGKPIVIGSRISGQTVTVFVADQGSGIAASETEAVFEEFYRESKPGMRHTEGLGLGLSLVRSYSQIMGLECRLMANTPCGTRIELDGLKRVSPQTSSRLQRSEKHLRLSGLKVHVVEGDANILSATTKLLDSWGCEVTSSKTIPQHKLGIDLLVTDMQLGPQVSGRDCIRTVRQNEGRKLPALIVSGLQNLDQAGLEIDQPFGIIEKPASAQQMRSYILSLLTREESLQDMA